MAITYKVGDKVTYRHDAYEPGKSLGAVLRSGTKLEWPPGWDQEPHGPSRDVLGVHWTKGNHIGRKKPVDRAYILPVSHLQDAKRRMQAFIKAEDARFVGDPTALDRMPPGTAVWDFIGLVWQRVHHGWRSSETMIVSSAWPSTQLLEISGAVKVIGPSPFWPN
ncbi:hypothetical protein ACFRAQ_35200 [Nocardia sp. NPDC056611]|uniref:hypothetical protein n=1 Tax=Nocardia sp. NPDC056611 TaxID=3345877 RepID=UPI0036710649